jgi:ubiquinone/menaquinone biosynthesis C-methylase UbiE
MTDATTTRIIGKYSADAAEYEAHRRDDPKWKGEHAAVANALRQLPPGAMVLDAPVGTGRFLKLYDELGLQWSGVDLCSEMIKEARKKHETWKDLSLGDCRTLDGWTNRSFDAVVCIRLFNLLIEADCAMALRNFARVLRPGGIALVSITTLPEPPPDKPRTIQREGAMLEAFAAAGFAIKRRVEVETAGRGLYEVWTLKKMENA